MPRAFSVPFEVCARGPPGQPFSAAGKAMEAVALFQMSWSTRSGRTWLDAKSSVDCLQKSPQKNVLLWGRRTIQSRPRPVVKKVS